MIDVVTIYFTMILAFQPIEEIYNCNHPNTLGDAVHIVCIWTDDDFYKAKSGDRLLKPRRKADNFIKAGTAIVLCV